MNTDTVLSEAKDLTQMNTDVILRAPKVPEGSDVKILRPAKAGLRHRPERSEGMTIASLAMTVALMMLFLSDNAYSLNVSPGRIEISVAPAKSYEDILIVRNTDKGAVEVKLRIEDWRKAVEGVGGVKGKTHSFNWLEIWPQEFELASGITKEVKMKVKVPKGAKGELNAMIFVEAAPKEIGEGAIGINTSIGIPIYVMIKGTEYFKAEVEDLKVITSSPLQLAITIKNSGNVHIRPTGTIVIASPEGAKQSLKITVPLNEYNYPILPNSSRTLEIRSDKILEPGEYMADVKMGYGDRRNKRRIVLKI